MQRLFIFIYVILFFSSLRATGTSGGYIKIEKIASTKYEIAIHIFIACQTSLSNDTSFTLLVGNSDSSSRVYPKYFGTTQKHNYCNKCKSDYWSLKIADYIFKCTLDITQGKFKDWFKKDCNLYARVKCDLVNATTPNYSPNVNYFSANYNLCNKSVFGTKLPEPSNIIQGWGNDVFYNPGFYPSANDSFTFSLENMEKDFLGGIVTYKSGFDAKYPLSCLCGSGLNNCTPNPFSAAPQGFSLNNISGDLTFRSKKMEGPTGLAILVKQYSKDSFGKWEYVGYTKENMILQGNGYGDYQPTFSIPNKIEICAKDTFNLDIKALMKSPIFGNYDGDTLYFKFAGNFNTFEYKIIDTNIFRPICKLKLYANDDLIRDNPYVLSVLVRNQACGYRQESTKSILIYIRNSISSIIEVKKDICNSIKANVRNRNLNLNVSNTWYVYKDSWKAKPFYNFKGDNFNLQGLNKAKYYIKCVVTTPNAYCTQRTYLDSVDLNKSWPGLDFGINPNAYCPYDSFQKYSAKGVSGFAKGFTSSWQYDTSIKVSDTLKRNFFSTKTIAVTLKDTAGCELKNTFTLMQDSIADLQFTRDTALCRPQSFVVGAQAPNSNKHWEGDITVISGNKDTFSYGLSYRVSFPYKNPFNSVFGNYTSSQSCKKSFVARIQVDSTQFVTDKSPEFCKGLRILNLNSIQHTPVGGIWTNNITNSVIVQVDTFQTYPKYFKAFYKYESYTHCMYTDTSSVKIADTTKVHFSDIKSVCKETAMANASEIFNPIGSTGKWFCTSSALSFTIEGSIKPRESNTGIYEMIYRTASAVCPTEKIYKLEIKPSLIQLQGSCDVNAGKTPLLVAFQSENKTISVGNTQYYWHFNDATSGLLDTSTAQNPSHTYTTQGTFKVMLSGEKQGCRDTFLLPEILVEVNGIIHLQGNNEILLYPNPIQNKLNIDCLKANLGKQKTMEIYSMAGQILYKSQFDNDFTVIDLSEMPSGLCLIKIKDTSGKSATGVFFKQ